MATRLRLMFWLGLGFGLFQLFVPVLGSLYDMQLRALHVLFGISLVLLALPLGGGVSFTGVVEPTISTRATYIDASGAVGYARDRFFVFVGVGLDVGGPID